MLYNFFVLPRMHFAFRSGHLRSKSQLVFFEVGFRIAFLSLCAFTVFHDVISFDFSQRVPNSRRITVQTIAMYRLSRISHWRAWLFRICTFTEGPVCISWLPLPQAKRIDPSRWIRRILVKIQPTRIADRVFADKPSDPWIIVPVPIVVQPCFMILVLTLKPDRVGQALALCPFRALFFDFAPRFVLCAPGDLAGGVGQFLWRAQVVALVPGQHVNG